MPYKEQIVLFRCHKSLLLLNIPTICECVCQPVQVVTDFHVRISRNFVFVITLIKVKWRKTGTILVIAFSEGRVLDIRWKSENERFLLLFLFLAFGRIRCFRVWWTNLWLFRILLFLCTSCSHHHSYGNTRVCLSITGCKLLFIWIGSENNLRLMVLASDNKHRNLLIHVFGKTG